MRQVALLLLLLAPAITLADPPLRIMAEKGDAARVHVEAQLPALAAKNLPIGQWSQDQGENWLRFALIKKEASKDTLVQLGLPMLGKYVRRNDTLLFYPRFDLLEGSSYQASFGLAGKDELTARYEVPRSAPGPAGYVVKVYPTSDVLPANVLKFYIYFSEPMQGGSAIFDQIQILDADGKVVRDPWLRDELWDEKGQRLIIYIHPGRIKWGVLLRQTLGPVFVPNREYTLVVRGSICNLRGQKLNQEFRKKFRTSAEHRSRVELAQWKLGKVEAGTQTPLEVTLPDIFDHACLMRYLSIRDAQGRKVAGTMMVGADEKSCSFTPEAAWNNQAYTLQVDGRLEDIAGNNPLRAFDVDLTAPRLLEQSRQFSFQAK